MRKEGYASIKKNVLIIGASCFLFSGCCYNSSKVLIQNPDLMSKNITLSYEGNNLFYQELRGALAEKGIKVLKYNMRTQKITQEKKHITETNEKRSQVEEVATTVDGSRYLLSVDGNTNSDIICLTTFSPIDLNKVIVEITDLDSKEVVFSMKASGLNEHCGYCRQTVYENIADKIYKFIKSAKR